MSLVLSLVVWLLAAGGAEEGAASKSFIAEGAVLPAFDLKTLDGERFLSKALAGKSGIVVFVRQGQPESLVLLQDLKRLEKGLAGASWERLAVWSGSVSAEAVRDQLKAASFSGKALLDPERTAYASFGVVAVPSLAVFDSRSRVVYSRAGLGKDTVQEVEARLRSALGLIPAEKSRDGPLRTAAKLKLARALLERDDLKAAERLLRQALAEEASLAGSMLLGEALLRGQKAEEALRRFQEAKEEHPESSRPEIGVARALAALGRKEEAEPMLRKLLLRGPDAWEAHLELGEAWEALGKVDLALREYKKAIWSLRRSWESDRQKSP